MITIILLITIYSTLVFTQSLTKISIDDLVFSSNNNKIVENNMSDLELKKYIYTVNNKTSNILPFNLIGKILIGKASQNVDLECINDNTFITDKTKLYSYNMLNYNYIINVTDYLCSATLISDNYIIAPKTCIVNTNLTYYNNLFFNHNNKIYEIDYILSNNDNISSLNLSNIFSNWAILKLYNQTNLINFVSNSSSLFHQNTTSMNKSVVIKNLESDEILLSKYNNNKLTFIIGYDRGYLNGKQLRIKLCNKLKDNIMYYINKKNTTENQYDMTLYYAINDKKNILYNQYNQSNLIIEIFIESPNIIQYNLLCMETNIINNNVSTCLSISHLYKIYKQDLLNTLPTNIIKTTNQYISNFSTVIYDKNCRIINNNQPNKSSNRQISILLNTILLLIIITLF